MAIDFLSLSYEEIKEALVAGGQPGYRADQLFDWVYHKSETDASRMTNLPAGVKELFAFTTSRVASSVASEDGTRKLLIEEADGERIETVLIPTDRFATACLSPQVGCAMGCAFCASGSEGFVRNLSASEILQQVLHLQQASDTRVSHVVFMGMGEPLANYDATVGAIRSLVDARKFNISARRVTVSTVGLPSQIRRLAREDLPITLAISLHAPNDALRRQLIPSAEQFGLEEIIQAAQEFFESRKREITLEYTLLEGVNDTNVCATALVGIARRLRCNVNLIRYNPTDLPYKRPSSGAIVSFAARLEKAGINVQIRRSRGQDVTAACGQLKRRAADEEQGPMTNDE
jgi:23S rRNA (adenine2503-C2)-methyltransferase